MPKLKRLRDIAEEYYCCTKTLIKKLKAVFAEEEIERFKGLLFPEDQKKIYIALGWPDGINKLDYS